MGCSSSHISAISPQPLDSAPEKLEKALQASVIIQTWFRRHQARLETRRRCTWKIFQTIEYAAEQDQISLYNFFNEMVGRVNDENETAVKFKQVLQNGFSLALVPVPSSDEVKADDETLRKIQKMTVDSTYKGPHVKMPLSLLTTNAIVDFVKNGRVLHAKYVKLILFESIKKLKTLPNILQANVNITKQLTICGDLHGKLDDLLTIFHKNGLPSADNPYIFNGDFVDRGPFSVEVLVILCCFFLLYPNEVYLNRGNHEDHIMNSRYGFQKEIGAKYKANAGQIKELCKELFSWLPLCTIVDNKLLVTHGGVSDKTDFDIIRKLERHKYSSVLKPSHISLEGDTLPEAGVVREWEQVLDLLWSDPQPILGRVFNQYRGGGCCFGPDVSAYILKKYSLNLIVRSHECKYEGYEYVHNGNVLTIFSASNYYAEGSNFGAYIKLGPDLKPFIVQFLVSKSSKSGTLQQRVGINESSALRELRENFYKNKEELLQAFKKRDLKGTGLLKIAVWSNVVESVLCLKLPWTILRHKLVQCDDKGNVYYFTCVDRFSVGSSLPQSFKSISETLYRNRIALETVFRLIDKDCSGVITKDEFKEACIILNDYAGEVIPPEKMDDLSSTLDMNKDGKIDFNEFLEAFRLVSISASSSRASNVNVKSPTILDTSDDSMDGTT